MSKTYLAIILIAFLGLVAPITAQLHSACNPVTSSSKCPADAALGKTFQWDFRRGPNGAFSTSKWWLPYIRYDSINGATLKVNASGIAPTLSTNFYIMYGRLEVVLKTAAGTGIVSDVIFESDSQDEIDLEWVATQPKTVQSNYHSPRGRSPSHKQMKKLTTSSNMHSTFHTYTVDWNADRLTWAVDGKVLRSVNAKNNDQYPQSPMKITLGLWAGGDSKNAPGTIAWAGGRTDYSKGPFEMSVRSVKVVDYSTGSSYSYGDKSGKAGSIRASNGAVRPHASRAGNPATVSTYKVPSSLVHSTKAATQSPPTYPGHTSDRSSLTTKKSSTSTKAATTKTSSTVVKTTSIMVYTPSPTTKKSSTVPVTSSSAKLSSTSVKPSSVTTKAFSTIKATSSTLTRLPSTSQTPKAPYSTPQPVYSTPVASQSTPRVSSAPSTVAPVSSSTSRSSSADKPPLESPPAYPAPSSQPSMPSKPSSSTTLASSVAQTSAGQNSLQVSAVSKSSSSQASSLSPPVDSPHSSSSAKASSSSTISAPAYQAPGPVTSAEATPSTSAPVYSGPNSDHATSVKAATSSFSTYGPPAYETPSSAKVASSTPAAHLSSSSSSSSVSLRAPSTSLAPSSSTVGGTVANNNNGNGSGNSSGAPANTAINASTDISVSATPNPATSSAPAAASTTTSSCTESTTGASASASEGASETSASPESAPPSSSSSSPTATASPTTFTTLNCPQDNGTSYLSPNVTPNKVYRVYCSSDLPPGTIGWGGGADIFQCIKQCDTKKNCTAVTYAPWLGKGACYYRGTVGNIISRQNATLAILDQGSQTSSSRMMRKFRRGFAL